MRRAVLWMAFWAHAVAFPTVLPRSSRPSRLAALDEEPLEESKQQKRDIISETLRKLAQLSLEDYEWRSGVFKSNEADRLVEESIARMRGEEPAFLRPMDAAEGKIGPLGRWEKSAVLWLSQVIDEEGRRAQRIVRSEGRLIRPREVEDLDDLGPLGQLEQRVGEWLQSIQSSEQERARTKTLRPKDLDDMNKGPLGQMEEAAVRVLEEIRKSERIRMEQSKLRGGEMVRPIDIPGPLGELELAFSEIFQAEKYRARQRSRGDGKLVRPKDASVRGPLGTAEANTITILEELSSEESERLRNFRKVMQENRPMETNRNSILGFIEALIVGILRAPVLLIGVIERVRELLASEVLENKDSEILEKGGDDKMSKSSGSKKDS